MLKRVSRALKGASPSVRVLSAGLPWPAQGMNPEPFLSNMLKVSGLLSAVDVFAVHPYGQLPFHVMQRVSSARRTLNARGASAKSMWITEVGWATGRYDGWWTVSPSQQASNLDTFYRQLLAYRKSYKILGGTWFSFQDHIPKPGVQDYWGFRSGLLYADGRAKPSWRVFVKRAKSGY
jgi:hypothetical protein